MLILAYLIQLFQTLYIHTKKYNCKIEYQIMLDFKNITNLNSLQTCIIFLGKGTIFLFIILQKQLSTNATKKTIYNEREIFLEQNNNSFYYISRNFHALNGRKIRLSGGWRLFLSS